MLTLMLFVVAIKFGVDAGIVYLAMFILDLFILDIISSWAKKPDSESKGD